MVPRVLHLSYVKEKSIPPEVRKRQDGGKDKTMTHNRLGFAMTATALAMFGVTGCATKNYVKNQTAPIIQHTGQLDNETAENNRQIHDVDERAQAGIKQAQNSADTANQNADNATKAASDANNSANDVAQRADSLDALVKNLDNYKQVADVSVTFGFDKAVLTADDRGQLDTFANQLNSAKNYILEVTGGTDSTGPADYNYALSNRRADAVVQYLVSKYNIAPHRFYLIGIGKDQEVAPNNTAEGRKKNRRVEVQLLSNTSGATETQQGQPSASKGQAASPAGQVATTEVQE
jgi:OmpA-OmpF porin, OOP family